MRLLDTNFSALKNNLYFFVRRVIFFKDEYILGRGGSNSDKLKM